MVDTKVETIARLAQWKIESFGPTTAYKRSDPFKIGIWNWCLSVERNRSMCVRLFPELLGFPRSSRRLPDSSYVSPPPPPIADPTFLPLSFLSAAFIAKLRISSGFLLWIHERVLRMSDDFACLVDINVQGRFIIDVEFLDLKIYPLNGGEAASIWPSDGTMQNLATQNTLRCLSRMLDEAIHADVTINTADGTLQAHKAILSASSPVFQSMFQHNLKEKESSTIDIEDMTTESCMALLSYLYGTMKQEDFWKHRLALLVRQTSRHGTSGRDVPGAACSLETSIKAS
ncbi:UNVERIFIED_CONTAM: BTB/POZ domain-containing protein [Sesamum radiatum]|uniref:BTB/POZ domain-containing protein n=1 Tax=Sesamum radiatum TaxID=300843 RepID=A0AAW2PXU9_SESRA